MKIKILKILLTTITYNIIYVMFGYRDNIQDTLMPTFMVLFVVINIFMMDKNKGFIENFLTLSGVLCLGFIIGFFLKDSYKPVIFQYLGLIFISSCLGYYLKKNYNLINSQE
ncbi:hypothetical protein [Epilithonimonas sp.]|uniref:hypothetical protein n=1 Tax=Epilithonimonas sp. TaxID=2894511 RepID=UPI002896684A|nr:hypothetical protein [Epilithonimonas sp.]